MNSDDKKEDGKDRKGLNPDELNDNKEDGENREGLNSDELNDNKEDGENREGLNSDELNDNKEDGENREGLNSDELNDIKKDGESMKIRNSIELIDRNEDGKDKKMDKNEDDKKMDMVPRQSEYQPADIDSIYSSTFLPFNRDFDEMSSISKVGLIGELDYFSLDEEKGKCGICFRLVRDEQEFVRCASDCRRKFHPSCANLESDDVAALSANPQLKWICNISDCKLSGTTAARDLKEFDKTLDGLLTQVASIRTESIAIRNMLGDVFDNMRFIRKELAQINPRRSPSEPVLSLIV